MTLGCDFFERRGEKRIDVRRFLGYVCRIAKDCFSDGSLFCLLVHINHVFVVHVHMCTL